MQQNNLDAGLDLVRQALVAYPAVWRDATREVKNFVADYAEIDAEGEAEFKDVLRDTKLACLPLAPGALTHFRKIITTACIEDIKNKQGWMARTSMQNAANLLAELDDKYITRIRDILRTDAKGLAAYPDVSEERLEGYMRAVNFSNYLKICVHVMNGRGNDNSCERVMKDVQAGISNGLIASLHNNLLLPMRPLRFTPQGQVHLDA